MVIGGRTSQGKSSLALQIAYDVAKQGFKVYFFSLEMSETSLMERLICNVCDIPNSELLKNPGLFGDRIGMLKEQIRDLGLILTYNIGATIDDLYDAINDLPAADVIILDYIQAIRGMGDKLSIVNDYILRFRRMCLQKNMCGIMLSQINREAMYEDRIPKLHQLKGSGVIEEHADTILLGHWDYFYSSNVIKKNKYDIIIAKQRNGVTGTLTVDFFPEYYKFAEVNGGESETD